MNKKNVKFVKSFGYQELAYEILDFIPRVGEGVVIDGVAWIVQHVKYDLKVIRHEAGGDQVIVELI